MTDNTQPVVQQDVEIPGIDAPNELLESAEEAPKAEIPKEPLPKSKYNGVSFAKINQKWVAKALLNPDENGKRKLKHIGYFEKDLDAALARNKYIEENGLTCRKSKIED